MSSCAAKCKDDKPIATINRIRNKLAEIGILTIESAWKNSVDGFYSVSVKITGTDLSTNGKGTTYEFALASAYGEMMERLQNQAFFRLNADWDPKALEYKGFYYAPDEKKISISNFINSEDDWTRIQMSRAAVDDITGLLELWKEISYEDVPADFIALPYFSLKTQQLSYIPIKMILKMYMSNGMCAGNTPQEAIVQGLSEILERYANIMIVKGGVVPPDIPRAYFDKFPELKSMIEGIEASGNFRVIIKDCSLDRGFPVVGVVFINNDDQSYFVKFGAHPIFEIAVERTLTELLQGQDIKSMMGLKNFSFFNEFLDNPENAMGILVNGSGYYPTAFFGSNFSYQFNEFKSVEDRSNKGMLNHLVSFLHDNGYEIFLRDVSFLGFPAFHIIVPGLSEIEVFNDIRAINEYIEYVRIKKYLRNFDMVSDKELDEVIGFMENFLHADERSVPEVPDLPIEGPLPWYYVSIRLFLAGLYYMKEDYVSSYKAFDSYVRFVQASSMNIRMLTFFKCVRDYVGARAKNMDDAEARDILAAFYPRNVVEDAIEEFSDSQNILGKYGFFKCWNCSQCVFQKQCAYSGMEKVYRIIKESYSQNSPSQSEIKTLLGL